METTVLDWLARVGSLAFNYSLWAFLLVNGAAIAAVVVTRDRSLVNRWTGRLLAANLVLAGTGLGVPMVTAVTRLAISVLTPSLRLATPSIDKTREEVPLTPPGDPILVR